MFGELGAIKSPYAPLHAVAGFLSSCLPTYAHAHAPYTCRRDGEYFKLPQVLVASVPTGILTVFDTAEFPPHDDIA